MKRLIPDRVNGAVWTSVLALAISAGAQAQTPAAHFVDSARTEIDQAVHDVDMARLDRTRVLLDRVLVAYPDDPYLLHYRGYLAYREATGLLMTGQKGSLPEVIAAGLADLSKSAEHVSWPETLQLEACLDAMRIPLEPGSGMTLGPLTGRLSAEAAKMGPTNPRVVLLQAYLARSTPESMGGGAARARALADKAVKLFADDHPGPLAPAWGKDEAASLWSRLADSTGAGSR